MSSSERGIDKQWEEDAIRHFTRPWDKRRGLESIESHMGSILVRASIDELADALSEIAVESRFDVISTEITGSPCFALTYQIVGQEWSAFLPDIIYNFPRLKQCLWPNAAELSRLLGQPTIDLSVSDVGCSIGHRLFEHGEIVEYFSGSEEDSSHEDNEFGIDAQRYAWAPYSEDPGLIQTAYFWSRYRQVAAGEIGNIWDLQINSYATMMLTTPLLMPLIS